MEDKNKKLKIEFEKWWLEQEEWNVNSQEVADWWLDKLNQQVEDIKRKNAPEIEKANNYISNFSQSLSTIQGEIEKLEVKETTYEDWTENHLDVYNQAITDVLAIISKHK